MKQICLVLPFYGKSWPDYLGLWVDSVRNRELDVLLVTDMPVDELNLPPNVMVLNLPFAKIKTLAEEKLGTVVALDSVRKLCDLKPFYGKVFEDYLGNYAYWAFGDADLVYGRALDALIDRVVASGCDVWSNRQHWISGGLCFVRNTEIGRNLAMRANNWRDVLANSTNLLFDELCCNDFASLERGEIAVADCAARCDSFSGVVWRADDLKVHHEDIICEDALDDASIEMDDGRLEIVGCGDGVREGIPVFHYINAKKHRSFTVPARGAADKYIIKASGVYSASWGLVRCALVCGWRKVRGEARYYKYRIVRFVKHRLGITK